MTMLFPILVFLTVSLAIIGLAVWLSPTRTEQRLQAMAGPAGKSAWTETAVKLVGPFAQLSSPTNDAELSPLRVRFLNAGIRYPDAYLVYFGMKTLLPLGFAALAFVGLRATGTADDGTVLMLLLALAALAGCYLPNLVLRLLIRARRREIFENFPDAADLMLVCVEAGLGLDAGLVKVTDEIQVKSRALAQELHWTNLEMRAGGTREKSLRNLALRTGVEEIGTFATMLTQADRFGTSIGESLRVFSDDLRHKRHVRAEELAAKVPTKMLVPLVLCIFPCISLVILTPAAIRVVRMIMPMLSGT
ncbi:type II secretion system F family protein [Variovorax sp. NFACC27]|uniref:Type II secretion system F family protein n=1 Tax=Variovorax gossypii TaxID=1679495 RepID=A0A431TRC9_9BURK|nr:MULTISPECIES: type II secretion system F family protein [Variovorax]MDP9600994.1 tight adherence protein C [Variovorax paradoxus]SEF33528.1 tight adherence protein C [Variovorax sp. NFACC28]SEG97324.1 tight adherence protein C [Variovorax sp. NFACC29]SFD89931.1 tight adherence protein C [Variovorax sp. NFACC26]SFH06131.1 tight adherence protein C [Variovorax sp. NFACC27]